MARLNIHSAAGRQEEFLPVRVSVPVPESGRGHGHDALVTNATTLLTTATNVDLDELCSW
jgi:hypothetical protein